MIESDFDKNMREAFSSLGRSDSAWDEGLKSAARMDIGDRYRFNRDMLNQNMMALEEKFNAEDGIPPGVAEAQFNEWDLQKKLHEQHELFLKEKEEKKLADSFAKRREDPRVVEDKRMADERRALTASISEAVSEEDRSDLIAQANDLDLRIKEYRDESETLRVREAKRAQGGVLRPTFSPFKVAPGGEAEEGVFPINRPFYLATSVGQGIVNVAGNLINTVLDLTDYAYGKTFGEAESDWTDYRVPEFDIVARRGDRRITEAIGAFSEGIVQYVSGYGVLSKIGKIAGVTSLANRAGSAGRFVKFLGQNGFTDMLAFDAYDPLIGDVFKDTPYLGPILEFMQLTTNEDDAYVERRIKRFLEGTAFGASVESVAVLAKWLNFSRRINEAKQLMLPGRKAPHALLEGGGEKQPLLDYKERLLLPEPSSKDVSGLRVGRGQELLPERPEGADYFLRVDEDGIFVSEPWEGRVPEEQLLLDYKEKLLLPEPSSKDVSGLRVGRRQELLPERPEGADYFLRVDEEGGIIIEPWEVSQPKTPKEKLSRDEALMKRILESDGTPGEVMNKFLKEVELQEKKTFIREMSKGLPRVNRNKTKFTSNSGKVLFETGKDKGYAFKEPFVFDKETGKIVAVVKKKRPERAGRSLITTKFIVKGERVMDKKTGKYLGDLLNPPKFRESDILEFDIDPTTGAKTPKRYKKRQLEGRYMIVEGNLIADRRTGELLGRIDDKASTVDPFGSLRKGEEIVVPERLKHLEGEILNFNYKGKK